MTETSSVLMFDTQRAVEELVAAGMPPEQASVIVRQQARWADRNFATGEDIDRLRTEVGQEFSHLREEFDRKLEAQGAVIAKDMSHLRESLELRIDAVDHKLDARCGALEAKIAQSAVNIIKWVTGSQVGTAAVYLAALLAAIKL